MRIIIVCISVKDEIRKKISRIVGNTEIVCEGYGMKKANSKRLLVWVLLMLPYNIIARTPLQPIVDYITRVLWLQRKGQGRKRHTQRKHTRRQGHDNQDDKDTTTKTTRTRHMPLPACCYCPCHLFVLFACLCYCLLVCLIALCYLMPAMQSKWHTHTVPC